MSKASKKNTSRKFFLVGIAVLLIVGLLFGWVKLTSSPEYTIYRLVKSLEDNNQQEFNNLVNANEVAQKNLARLGKSDPTTAAKVKKFREDWANTQLIYIRKGAGLEEAEKRATQDLAAKYDQELIARANDFTSQGIMQILRNLNLQFSNPISASFNIRTTNGDDPKSTLVTNAGVPLTFSFSKSAIGDWKIVEIQVSS